MLTQRFDSVPIRDPQIDKQTGFLHVKRVPIAQTMVQPYLKADGSIDMEAKLPTELLSDQTVASANNKPVTDDHPSELVTKDNSSKYMKGMTDSVAHVEGNQVFNDITITDADLINEIMTHGKRELSIGFEAEVVPQFGEYNGAKYDSVQRNIRINHVAVVNKGRAGHNVRLLGDSAVAIDQDKGVEMPNKLKQVLLDGKLVTVLAEDADDVSQANSKLQNSSNSSSSSSSSSNSSDDDKDKQIADLKQQVADLKQQVADLKKNGNEDDQKSADQAQAKADAAEKELEALKAKYEGDGFDKAIQARLNLIAQVKPYVGDSYDFKGKSPKQMKIDAIKTKDDSIELDDKSDDYVEAYFDSMRKNSKPASVVGYQGNVGVKAKQDSMPDRYHLANRGGKN